VTEPTEPTKLERPWATWKVTLAFFVTAFVLDVVALVILLPGQSHTERGHQISRASGAAIFFLTIAVAFLQSYRIRRWRTAAAAEQLGELLLSSTTGVRIVGDRPQPGRIDLTATRLVFFRASRSDGVWGQLIGTIASGRGTDITLELKLGEVASTARTKFRSAHNAMDIAMTDGTVHRFAFDQFAPFEAQLVPALARVRAATAAAPT
jgi:hypothetical protein